MEGIPPERKTVLRSRPAPAPPFLPEVKGLDSCPIALATVAAIRTFQEPPKTQDNRKKKKKLNQSIGRATTSKPPTNEPTLLRASSAISPGPRWREAAAVTARRRAPQRREEGNGGAVVLGVGEKDEGGGRRGTQDEEGMWKGESWAMAVGTAWRAGGPCLTPVACPCLCSLLLRKWFSFYFVLFSLLRSITA